MNSRYNRHHRWRNTPIFLVGYNILSVGGLKKYNMYIQHYKFTSSVRDWVENYLSRRVYHEMAMRVGGHYDM